MENMVGQFIEENKLALHHQLLDSLELFQYEEIKEYAPHGYSDGVYGPYPKSEIIDGVKRYYRITKKKVYPQITDGEYEKLLTISREKEHIEEKRQAEYKRNNPEKKPPLKFTIMRSNGNEENFAVSFMRGLAWFLWIGGLIVSIFAARTEVINGYSTKTIFQWSVFSVYFSLYLTAGSFCLCFSQVFSNIQSIASAIQSFHVTEDSK